MDFDVSTPALLFSVISLFAMAHTNRFLALANLIRQSIGSYEENRDDKILRQIGNFKRRLNMLKYSQIAAVISFMLCVISMFLSFISNVGSAKIMFGLSLVALFSSLLMSMHELFLSIGALNIEMERLEK